MRRLMDACRAINELVFAILFVAAVGLGPFAGVMALFIHNLGVISKLFSEAVEAIDPRPVEGIRATGASRLQQVIYGVIPQVLPLWRSEEHTSELQSLMRISYAVFCSKKQNTKHYMTTQHTRRV